MNKKYAHLPLKAWEVYYKNDYSFGRELSCGIFAGHHEGEAKSSAIDDREVDNAWRGLRCRRVYGQQAEEAIERYEDRGKYWRNTKRYARLQAEAEAFNALYPVGTVVRVVNCCEADHWPDGLTKTRTPAWAPSETAVLVSLEGYAGGFYLKNIEVVVPAELLPDEAFATETELTA